MNDEIIQRIYNQSVKLCIAQGDMSAWSWEKKFAELIVQECLMEIWYDATPKQISANIRNKFGIKE